MARSRTRRNVNATSPWPFVGMAGMACAFFLYAASGVVAPAPWWGVTALLVVWVLLFVVACAWWSLHPRWVPFLAVFAMVFWFAAVTAGVVWLDWTT